jgi:DNA-binding NarL/FixJ family response regulator
MGLHVLIAEPRSILRMGLRALFAENSQVEQVYEAPTGEELHQYLTS